MAGSDVGRGAQPLHLAEHGPAGPSVPLVVVGHADRDRHRVATDHDESAFSSLDNSGASTPVLVRSSHGSVSSLLGRMDAAFGSTSTFRPSPLHTESGPPHDHGERVGMLEPCEGLGHDPSHGHATASTAMRDVRASLAYSIPNEVLLIIMSHVANRRQRHWKYSHIRSCTLVDRRWNMCASSFLWSQVDIERDESLKCLVRTLASPLQTLRFFYGRFVKRLSLFNVSVLAKDWSMILNSCANLESLSLEKFFIGRSANGPRLFLPDLDDHSASDEDSDTDSATNPPASAPELVRFRELAVADSPSLKLKPIMRLLQRSPRTKRLSISGCNFNEEDMCSLVVLCPHLVDVSLGSHMTNGQMLSGSAGGDAFAAALATTCPDLRAADLTGIVSMTDEGFVHILEKRGARLEKLQIRRAMQISIEALAQIAHYCSAGHLRKLTLANIPHLSEDLLMGILQSPLGASLESLQLEALPISDETLAAVGQLCVRLKVLRLYDLCQVTDLHAIIGGGSSVLPKLRQLVLHDMLAVSEHTNLESQTSSSSVNSDSPAVGERLIYDISEMEKSPVVETPDMTTPQSAMPAPHLPPNSVPLVSRDGSHPDPAASPRRFQQPAYRPLLFRCSISSPALERLQVIACPAITEETLNKLLHHWTHVRRFIYVGAGVSRSFRRQLAKTMPRCNSSVYALTPTTPGEE
ncbi:hypothetical protein BC831DRAFT_481595 [Entophlyctis helioformis]|nr:hypothetical protein BC831DRAFT_481595 [Entophlyctis helioformis]